MKCVASAASLGLTGLLRRSVLIYPHGRPFTFVAGREYTPRAVVVPEKKNRQQAGRTQRLDAYIASVIRTHATKACDMSRHRRSWRQPFFDEQTQGPLTGVHCLLL